MGKVNKRLFVEEIGEETINKMITDYEKQLMFGSGYHLQCKICGETDRDDLLEGICKPCRDIMKFREQCIRNLKFIE